MDQADIQLITHLIPKNEKLRKLYNEHVKLDKQVARFQDYSNYSATAALRQQELKKAKLKGVDSIMEILNQHREINGQG